MKAGYILLDGCGDRPDSRLNYTTPLEAALTPNLDSIAEHSKLGRVITVGKGISPESDIAVFNMLGYSFDSGYPGRGVIETVGIGLPFEKGDLAMRANFASARGRKIVDRRAGRDLSQSEAEMLAEEVNGIKLKDSQFDFRATVSYRGVLVFRAGGHLSASISNTDPAYERVGGFGAAKEVGSDERVMKCFAEDGSKEASASSALVNEFTDKAMEVLKKSRVNRARIAEGKLPANCILLRDAGDHLPDLVPFKEKFGYEGTALVEMPAEVGIAKLLAMKMVAVKDMNDLKEKASLFRSELKEKTLVYVHIKGPDIFGHDGDAVGKKKCVESIDREFFSTLRDCMDFNPKIGVSCDHATPCILKKHSDDPVPLLITTEGKGDASRFSERNARKGSLGLMKGSEVLRRVLSGR